MKITSLCLPTAALGVAATLFTFTPASEGFSTLGFSLGTAQLDLRVFNNFTDAAANDFTGSQTQFPGYDGAELALWKGAIEWASRLHGTGGGDGHQPLGLGSGGANFDPTWQGNANGIGGVNDNVASEISGDGGGVLAFTEGPSSNGWRIRFYASPWTWADGPGTSIGGGTIDLQGVMCHEYGHALGLGHSQTGSATMFFAISGNGVVARSIHPDDINGVKAIYGTANFATKPIIDSVTITGTQITVTGSNFTPTLNRMWFTQAGTGGTGQAVKVTGLASTGGGTSITTTIPAAAGPGDVLIRNNTAGTASMSNPFPVDPGDQSCPLITSYCTTSPNSVGSGAIIGSGGSQSVSTNNFSLFATGLPNFQNGIFYYGPNQISQPFGEGVRCIGGTTHRLDLVTSDSIGIAVFALDITNPPSLGGQITAGSTWNFQYWYRDPAGGGSGFNLSDGLEVPFCD